MMHENLASNLDLTSLIFAALAAFVFGLTKSGLKGLGVLGILIMAFIFGSKSSTGIVLPILMMGDIFAVLYYRRNIVWEYFFKLLPWIVGGVLIGVWLGRDMPEAMFKKGMAIIILISVGVVFFQERMDSKYIPDYTWFAGSMGVLAGIATMLGNLAGAFTNIYMLSMRVDKRDFIGTLSFLYFLVNIFKFPFHVWSWETITQKTLVFDLMMAPFLLLGLLIGVWLVAKINNSLFRKIILILTAMGALIILVR